MSEDFLHYVWNQRLFYPSGLTTTEGLPIEIIHPGWPNHHAGPDFFNARIRIDGTLWAGNVEIHQQSSDWFRHSHHTDGAYNNVVLHVVETADRSPIQTRSNRSIPQLVLSYPPHLQHNYHTLLNRSEVIKCKANLPTVSQMVLTQWLERLAIEKMEQRNEKITHLYQFLKGNWDQVAFVLLARAIGFGTNADPMEQLARSLPIKTLLKHASSQIQLEALLLGQAGLLQKAKQPDDHTLVLLREYQVLQQKYRLVPMESSVWKYLRMRPANFPDIRLAQLAALLAIMPGNFETRLQHPFPSPKHPFLQMQTLPYWKTHYKLGTESPMHNMERPGIDSLRLLMVNAVIPFLFTLANRRSDGLLKDKTMQLWQELPSEKNHLLLQWKQAGIFPADEIQAQALLHLTKNYCIPGKCLHCSIGHALIQNNKRAE